MSTRLVALRFLAGSSFVVLDLPQAQGPGDSDDDGVTRWEVACPICGDWIDTRRIQAHVSHHSVSAKGILFDPSDRKISLTVEPQKGPMLAPDFPIRDQELCDFDFAHDKVVDETRL